MLGYEDANMRDIFSTLEGGRTQHLRVSVMNREKYVIHFRLVSTRVGCNEYEYGILPTSYEKWNDLRP